MPGIPIEDDDPVKAWISQRTDETGLRTTHIRLAARGSVDISVVDTIRAAHATLDLEHGSLVGVTIFWRKPDPEVSS